MERQFRMSSDVLLRWIDIALLALLVVAYVLSLCLSGWVATRKLPWTERVFPLVLQLVYLVLAAFPRMTHGFPSELFIPMIVVLVLAIFALVSGYRLYRLRLPIPRILAFSQSAFALGVSVMSFFAYLDSCYLYYGKLVWFPKL